MEKLGNNLQYYNPQGDDIVKQSKYSSITLTESNPSNDSKLFRLESSCPKKVPHFSLFFALSGGLLVSSSLLLIRAEEFRIFFFFLSALISAAVYWFYRHAINTRIVAESVLAVKGLGLQFFAETRKGALVNMRFIELEKIKQILIVEGLTALSVIVYPAVELRNASSHSKKTNNAGNLALPFQHIQVPLAVSVDVCKGLRAALGLSD